MYVIVMCAPSRRIKVKITSPVPVVSFFFSFFLGEKVFVMLLRCFFLDGERQGPTSNVQIPTSRPAPAYIILKSFQRSSFQVLKK